MWMSSRKTKERQETPLGEFGQVTIGGKLASVYVDGERRDVSRMEPYGYSWTPRQGQTVALLHTGEGKKPCILGVEAGENEGADVYLGPGDVYISVAEESGIRLCPDGSIYLTGFIFANGTLISRPEPEVEDD